MLCTCNQICENLGKYLKTYVRSFPLEGSRTRRSIQRTSCLIKPSHFSSTIHLQLTLFWVEKKQLLRTNWWLRRYYRKRLCRHYVCKQITGSTLGVPTDNVSAIHYAYLTTRTPGTPIASTTKLEPFSVD